MAQVREDVVRLVADLPRQQKREIALLADKLGITISELIQRATDNMLDQYPEVREIAARLYQN